MSEAILAFSHAGVCVADLERALRFYRDGLGFREVSALDLTGEPSATLLGLPGVALRARFLERDGVRIELLHYPAPGVLAASGPGAMNAPGLTHLSFRVADLDAALAALRALGARVLTNTRIRQHGTQAVFVADPDGTRIELIEAPGDPRLAPSAPPAGAR